MLQSALELYDQGLSLVPIVKGKKSPAVGWKKYQDNRATREEIIRWVQSGKYDLGVVTGKISGITVIDCDSQDAVNKVNEFLPDGTPLVVTPRGGAHFYFAYDSSLKTGTDAGADIDVRNDGGIVVVPPTTRGTESYFWIGELEKPLPAIPDKIKRLLLSFVVRPVKQDDLPSGVTLDVSGYLNHYGVEFTEKEGEGCKIFQLHRCPFCHKHTTGDGLGHAAVFLKYNGKLTFNCKHSHCSTKKWEDVRWEISRDDPLTDFLLIPDDQRSMPSDGLLRFALTDLGNSELFEWAHRDFFAFLQTKEDSVSGRKKGVWLGFDGVRWTSVKEGTIRNAISDLLRKKAKQAIDTLRGETQQERRDQIVKHCLSSESGSRREFAITEIKLKLCVWKEEFDADPMVLCCSNGLVNLATGRLREGTKDDKIHKSTNVLFDPSAKCPRWVRFINEIFQNKLDLIQFIQMAIGYSLTGLNQEQCFFILWGEGQNGKSTLLEVLLRLLGDYGQGAEFKTFLDTRTEHVSNEVKRMMGMRFIKAVELKETAPLNQERLKLLTGGDTITARALYQESEDFQFQAKLWFGVNKKPVIDNVDKAMERRLRIVPFLATFPMGSPKRDGGLKEKLFRELPGILNWAIQGCLMYQKQVAEVGYLPIPADVKKETDEFVSDSDTLKRFLSEKTNTGDPRAKVRSGVLFGAFQHWCGENNEKSTTQTTFGIRMREHGFASHKEQGVVYYRGISLF